MQQAHDYLAEVDELSNLLRDQLESIFFKKTLFKSWTVNDVIGHLYMFDLAALKSLQNEDEFARCCQTNENSTNENSHRIAGAALIYALNSWRHSARAAVRLSLKLSRE